MSVLGVGAGEALLVFIVALIVIGPHRFPEAMRSAGRWYRMARAYSNEVMKDVRAAVDDIEREVNEETADLKSVRELTDISSELRETQRAAEDAQKGTAEALQDNSAAVEAASSEASSTTPRPIRPSQRSNSGPGAADTTGGEQGAGSSTTDSGKSDPADAPKSFDPFQKKTPARPARAAEPRSVPPQATGNDTNGADGSDGDGEA